MATAGSARAQTNYPANATIEVRDGNGNLITGDVGVYPGDPMNIVSGGWMAGTTVTFTFFSDPILLGTKVADSQGVVRATFLVPDVPPGMHTLRLTGTGADGNPRTVDYPIKVLARPTSVGGASLDRPSAAGTGSAATGTGGAFGKTGFDHLVDTVAVGFSLLCVGAALILAVRRSRRDQLA